MTDSDLMKLAQTVEGQDEAEQLKKLLEVILENNLGPVELTKMVWMSGIAALPSYAAHVLIVQAHTIRKIEEAIKPYLP